MFSEVVALLAVTAGLAVVGFLEAVLLWRRHSDSPPNPRPNEHRINLSIALGTGASVALLLTVLQLLLLLITTRQAVGSARENIKLAIAVAPDLSGFHVPKDPADGRRDLSMTEYWFRGKKLEYAFLQGVDLRGVDFGYADLGGAFLKNASLQKAMDGRATDLIAANLEGADLRDANLREANLTEADLSGAFVEGARFDGAKLDWADLRILFCGVDTNHPRRCGELDLIRLGLPDYRTAPTTACLPQQPKIGSRKECGDEARLVTRRRG